MRLKRSVGGTLDAVLPVAACETGDTTFDFDFLRLRVLSVGDSFRLAKVVNMLLGLTAADDKADVGRRC